MAKITTNRLTATQVVELRNILGVNQTVFWSAVGVTQSGGSRYESGRKMPKTVEIAIRQMWLAETFIDAVKAVTGQLPDMSVAVEAFNFKPLDLKKFKKELKAKK